MGRGVERHPYAVAEVFFDVSWMGESDTGEYDLDEASWQWDDFVGDVMEALQNRFKSFTRVDPNTRGTTVCHDGWPMQETRALLRNEHAVVCVAEYCGLAVVSLVPREDVSRETENLAGAWCGQIERGFRKAAEDCGRVLYRQGTMSNGVSVYQRKTDESV